MLKRNQFLFFIFFLIYGLLCNHTALACTRVLRVDKGQAVMVGRNMDWLKDMQTNLFVYPAGIAHSGLVASNPLQWTSRYGSIVASAHHAITSDINDVTTDGMNENGLAAHLLVLFKSDYGQRNEKVPGLSILLWAQYYLDNFRTVDEAVRFTETAPFQLVPFYDISIKRWINLHLALEDAQGDSAIIEYINGVAHIYHHPNDTVITNDPSYDQQLINAKQYQGLGGNKPLPGSTNPQDRFVRALYYLTYLPNAKSSQDELAAVLSIMENTSQPYSMPTPLRPVVGYTVWHTVLDLTHGVYYFNSANNFNMLWVQLNQFNLKPGADVMELELVNQSKLTGDVTKMFKPVHLYSS